MASVTGGDKLMAILEKKAAEFARVNNPKALEVGFLEDATYPDGTSVAMVAAIQEYGAPGVGIPPRPFFRKMVAKHKSEWGPALGRYVRKTKGDLPMALAYLGERIAGELRESIISIQDPPLSPVTVMLRDMKSRDQSLVVTRSTVEEARQKVAAGESNHGASTKPLVETGHMLARIDYRVVGK